MAVIWFSAEFDSQSWYQPHLSNHSFWTGVKLGDPGPIIFQLFAALAPIFSCFSPTSLLIKFPSSEIYQGQCPVVKPRVCWWMASFLVMTPPFCLSFSMVFLLGNWWHCFLGVSSQMHRSARRSPGSQWWWSVAWPTERRGYHVAVGWGFGLAKYDQISMAASGDSYNSLKVHLVAF